MKKHKKVLINICLVIICALFLITFAYSLKNLIEQNNLKIQRQEQLNIILDNRDIHDYMQDFLYEHTGLTGQDNYRYDLVVAYNDDIKNIDNILVGSYVLIPISIIGNVASLGALILLAIKDLPIFKPIADKFAAHKEKRTQVKAERAEAEKQAKIQNLEKQLEELKKDE